MNDREDRYRLPLVVLHWLVAALVVVQFVTGPAIGRTHAAAAAGRAPDAADLVLHTIHNRVGLAMLALVLLRLALRLRFGAPPATPGASAAIRRSASLVHAAFYVVLIAQALTGAVARYLWWPIASVHVGLSRVLLALVALHVAAVVWHVAVRREPLLRRMTPSLRRDSGRIPG